MSLALTFVTIILNALSSALLWANARRGISSLGPAISVSWALAIVVHGGLVYVSSFANDGLDLSFFKAFSLSALLLSATFFFVCWRREELAVLGLIVLPLAAVSALLEYINTGSAVAIQHPVGIQVHVISSLMAFTFINLAAMQAGAIFLQDRSLKRSSSPSFLSTLLPLTAMESFLFGLLTIGIVLLSMSLASGWLYHEDLFAQHLVHKTVLSFLAWGFFIAILSGHLLLGWRGKNVWKAVLAGAVLLILAYFGSKFVLELVLSRT